MEQHGIAEHIKIVGEHGADAEAGKLDGPALVVRLVTVKLFDQQHAQHGGTDPRHHARRHAQHRVRVQVQHIGDGEAKKQHVERRRHRQGRAQPVRQGTVGILIVAEQHDQERGPDAIAQHFGDVRTEGVEVAVGAGPGQQGARDGGDGGGGEHDAAVRAPAPGGRQHTTQ